MKEGGRANALLVELLLVIFFFMLAATVLVELFAGAKHKTLQARAMNTAVMEAENIADDIYGADDPDVVLTALGFTKENDTWTRKDKEYTLTVTATEEAAEAGTLQVYTINGTGDGVDLFTLPSTRYIPKEVSP